MQGAISIIINEDDIIADVTINSRSICTAQSGFCKKKGQWPNQSHIWYDNEDTFALKEKSQNIQ